MNRFIPIVTTPLVMVGRFDHPEGLEHHDPGEEISDCRSVNFVERGGFALQTRGREWRLEAGMVLALGPGDVYHCRHQERHPSDVCLTVGFELEFAAEAVRTAGAPASTGFRVRPQSNRLGYLKLLLGRTPNHPGASLATESLAGEILSAVWSEGGTPRRSFRTGQLAWYAERVRAACDLFQHEYSQDHSLSSLGRRFGMSPFHFARMFRELAGTPPHRYLLSVRLEEAARRLREGSSVTNACFASGFSHLSHFGRLFQRRFGVMPSQYPRAARRGPADWS
ncbi:MAG: AraC family transcriptional regulator [Acidobacteria bacterium]|nr:AraC family transcriptional regulator [Acidobacteriota bacterium]